MIKNISILINDRVIKLTEAQYRALMNTPTGNDWAQQKAIKTSKSTLNSLCNMGLLAKNNKWKEGWDRAKDPMSGFWYQRKYTDISVLSNAVMSPRVDGRVATK